MSPPISYLLATLLLLFFNFHGSQANFLASPNCSSTGCGNGVEIHYPFWKMENSTADQYCGYPGFGLKCSDSEEPILDLPNNDSYYVRDIDYTLSTITLVDIDVLDQECPRAKHNTSVGTLPFDYSPLDVNLSFYFNCNLFPGPLPILCLGNDSGSYGNPRKSYVFKEGEEPEWFDRSENCEEKVVVTVKEAEAIGELIFAFGNAMKRGFVLNWSMAEECGSCEANGGRCGYNQTAPEVLCYCKDGRITSVGTTSNGLCKKGTISLARCLDHFSSMEISGLFVP